MLRYSDFEKRVAEVRAHAEAHVWDPKATPDFVPVQDTRHVALLGSPEGNIRFVFTVTKWEGKTLRQLSIHSDNGHPHPTFIGFWALQFGFTGTPKQWQVEDDRHGNIVILQPLTS